jgi:hypothetical protein
MIGRGLGVFELLLTKRPDQVMKSTRPGLGIPLISERNPVGTLWADEDGEPPDPAALDNSSEAVSSRSWFGAHPEGSWGFDWYTRGDRQLTDRRKEEEPEDMGNKKIKVCSHTRSAKGGARPKPKSKGWIGRLLK